MERTRTYIFCFSLGLCMLISCKLYENKKHDKREDAELEWQYEEQRQSQYSFRQDTLSRTWYFWTDSAFRFHPDSGLFALSGSVLAQESKVRTGIQMQDQTEQNNRGKQKETKHDRSINRGISVKYFWLVGLAVVLLILWRWGRSRLLV